MRIYGIGLVPEPKGEMTDLRRERLERKYNETFEESMSSFDDYVIATVGEDTDADDVLYAIGQGL